MLPGYNQEMTGVHRLDIHESRNEIILKDHADWTVSVKDLAKNTIHIDTLRYEFLAAPTCGWENWLAC